MALAASIIEAGGRRSACLENDRAVAVIDAVGGMMPVFGLRRGSGLLNAHWIPHFRALPGPPFSAAEHLAFWKAPLLYNLAGDFPCCPNFGAPCAVGGASLPAHGWTANEAWRIEGVGVDREGGAAWAFSSLRSPDPAMPLVFRKRDLVLEGQAAYYSVMTVKNEGPKPLSVNIGRHNTLGPPFLGEGCRISASAERYATAPEGGEFDATGRLAMGAEFDRLESAPLRGGGRCDLSVVPGVIGHSDLVTGAVPPGLGLGWSCVLNPGLGLAYLSFFPGRSGLPADEVALGFNDFWLQYGGRGYTPWALCEGGPDLAFCLGAENAVGAYANGLEYSLGHPELLGNPTTVLIPAGGERRLLYGTALVEVGAELVREGVRAAEAREDGIVIEGSRSGTRLDLDGSFERIRRLEGSLP